MKKIEITAGMDSIAMCVLVRTQKFDDLTVSETQIVVDWYNEKTGNKIATPINQLEFMDILNYMDEFIDKHKPANIKDEDFNMSVFAYLKGVKEGVKVQAGKDLEQFKNAADGALEGIKNFFVATLNQLDPILGTSAIKDTIMSIVYEDTKSGATQKSLGKVAENIRDQVQVFIKRLMAMDPDCSEQTLKKVTALKKLVTVDGKTVEKSRSFIEAVFNAIVWVGKKVTRVFKKYFLDTNPETNVFGSIGAALAAVMSAILGLAYNVLKLIGTVVLFVGSYIFGAVIKAITFVASTIKDWSKKSKDKFSNKDAEEDAKEEE